MNPRLIFIVNNVFLRKWRIVADVMTSDLHAITYRQCTEKKINFYLHKKLDLSYSQYRLFHHSTYLYKRRKTREEKNIVKDFTPLPSKHKQKRVIDIWKNMTVKELANSLEMSVDNVLEVMEFVPKTEDYYKGSSVIDNFDTLQRIVKQLGHRWVVASKNKESAIEVSKDVVKQPPPDPSVLVKRYPVVTVMGHVDHGKTTLLDTLRNTSVVEREFGGITQHIGAFSVPLDNNRKVTFLDTPGHAAFSSMRSRGARATDIVVLVVAADDGVMEQTDESIRMARDAQVPIIVAINKIDKPQADIERTKKMLLQRGIQLEDEGGDVQSVPISALKGTNVNALVEAISVQSEVMELKGDPTGLCEGVIIESKHDPKRGKLATLLVQRGTLKKGTVLVAGFGWAKVKMMYDDNQKEMISADPSTPVEIMGWKILPSAGDVVMQVESEKRAREVIDWREKQKMLEKSEEDQVSINMKLDEHNKEYKAKLQLKRKMGRRRLKPTGPREKEIKEDSTDPKLSIIVKGDVDGSVEAIIDILATYRSSLCKLDVVHFEVGNVSLNDVDLADSFNAVIYTFNVDMLPEAEKLAKEKDIKIRQNNVIYKLIDDLKIDISKQLPLLDQEEILGEADVIQQFVITDGRKKMPVAGSRCTKGALKKNALYRVVRDGEVIYEGRLNSMRHLKDEVDTIKKGSDCGLRFDTQAINFEPGDFVVCYVINKIEQKTDWDPGF